MSTGLGRFHDKRTKINYMQKVANKTNQEMGYNEDYYETFDNFEPVLIKKREKLIRDQDRVEKLPFEIEGNIEPMFGPLNIGLRKVGKSETGARYREMETFYKNLKSDDPAYQDARNSRKAALEHDKKMKKEIRKDHIAEMYGGKRFKKEHVGSEFMEQYTYTKEMQEDVDTIEIENHLKKNDLNQYLEAYIKCKNTMRDFVAPPKKT